MHALKVVTIALVLALAASTARGDNWVTVLSTTIAGAPYSQSVETDSMISTGNIVTYWMRDTDDKSANSLLSNGTKAGHVEVQMRMDCSGMWEIETSLRRRVHPDTGAVMNQWRMDAKYVEGSKKYYLPDTYGMDKAKQICGLAQAKAKHKWESVGQFIQIDESDQTIEGPRIRAWVRIGEENAMMNFSYLVEMNCTSGRMRSLADQVYYSGVPGPVVPRDDTPEMGVDGMYPPIYYTLCKKVEVASNGKYVAAHPQSVELKALPEPSKAKSSWLELTNTSSGKLWIDLGTLGQSDREILAWFRLDDQSVSPGVGAYNQVDCLNKRIRNLGFYAGGMPTRFPSVGNWDTETGNQRGLIQSVCGAFDQIVRMSDAIKRPAPKIKSGGTSKGIM